MLRLVARGHRNEETAKEVLPAPATVKTCGNALLDELAARDLVWLVVLAYACRVVTGGQ